MLRRSGNKLSNWASLTSVQVVDVYLAASLIACLHMFYMLMENNFLEDLPRTANIHTACYHVAITQLCKSGLEHEGLATILHRHRGFRREMQPFYAPINLLGIGALLRNFEAQLLRVYCFQNCRPKSLWILPIHLFIHGISAFIN